MEAHLTAEPFELSGLSYPESFRLVGPGVWEPASVPVPWLDEVEEPLVLVTASSERQGDDGLIRTAIEALGGSELSRWRSPVRPMTPVSSRLPATSGSQRWLPHLPIVPCAAAVICHGGMGITQKALAAGAPVCVVPFGRDQFEVAKLVGRSGCGTVAMPDQLNSANLASAVSEAMAMRAGAERVADGFRSAGGPAAAADAVQRVLVGASLTT